MVRKETSYIKWNALSMKMMLATYDVYGCAGWNVIPLQSIIPWQQVSITGFNYSSLNGTTMHYFPFYTKSFVKLKAEGTLHFRAYSLLAAVFSKGYDK